METNNSDNYVLVLEDRSQAKSADEAGTNIRSVIHRQKRQNQYRRAFGQQQQCFYEVQKERQHVAKFLFQS